MDTPLTLDEIRTAVGDLTAAFLNHQPLTDHQWDHAIATLLCAREQHGGRIRRLIHVILDAGRPDQPADHLPDALDELHCHLAVADDPSPATRPPAKHRAKRRSATRRRAVAPTQLSLFEPAAHPDAPPSTAPYDRTVERVLKQLETTGNETVARLLTEIPDATRDLLETLGAHPRYWVVLYTRHGDECVAITTRGLDAIPQ